jgi:type I site-specific restriction endonuclease
MELGREVLARARTSDNIDSFMSLADALSDECGRHIGDSLAKALGAIYRQSTARDEELTEAREALPLWKARADNAESKYREACLELNRLRADGVAARDTIRKQAADIAAYREQRDAEGARAANLARQFDSSDRQWKAERLAHEALDMATRPLMNELGGLTLSMLPKGAYGASLASEYSEARPMFAYADARVRAAAYGEGGA